MGNGFPFAYAVVVLDGEQMRQIGPAALGEHRATIESVLLVLVAEARAAKVSHPGSAVSPQPVRPAAADTMTQGEIARAQGFTGDCCTTCGQFAMKRSGTCLTCTACGSTSGCG